MAQAAIPWRRCPPSGDHSPWPPFRDELSRWIAGAIACSTLRTDPSAMAKKLPPAWSLPGDSKNRLLSPPGFEWTGSVEVTNSVATPPTAQPSWLVRL